MPTTLKRAEYAELMGLFFLLAMSMGMWTVPLSVVLRAHGYDALVPFAFATGAIAAFVSPLIFGSMADRHLAPATVMRYLCFAVAGAQALTSTAIRLHAPTGIVLGCIQLLNLCASPTWSIANTIVLARLHAPERQFGPIRSFATFGWIGGCWIVSLLGADSSTMSGYSSAIGWLLLAVLTTFLPRIDPPASPTRPTLRQRMGWDALVLLRNRDHRVIFIVSALFCIPLASLFPYTPPHLRELGFNHLTAWMSIAQSTEVLIMFLLAALFARWRVKWIITLGISLAIVRFFLCALDTPIALVAGLTLHGCSFTLVLITVQIYLNERVDREYRARAQALMSLMTSGAGNLIGFLGTGGWHHACVDADGRTHWSIFWLGHAAITTAVLAYFLAAYRGIGKRPPQPKPAGAPLTSPPTP